MDDEEGYRAPLLELWTPHGANVTRVNVPLITLINKALCRGGLDGDKWKRVRDFHYECAHSRHSIAF